MVEKSWCNESLQLISNVTKLSPKDFLNSFKDFANKSQVKHSSTVSEPSILFHTLANLADAENIANVHMTLLTLELKNFTSQYKHKP